MLAVFHSWVSIIILCILFDVLKNIILKGEGSGFTRLLRVCGTKNSKSSGLEHELCGCNRPQLSGDFFQWEPPHQHVLSGLGQTLSIPGWGNPLPHCLSFCHYVCELICQMTGRPRVSNFPSWEFDQGRALGL